MSQTLTFQKLTIKSIIFSIDLSQSHSVSFKWWNSIEYSNSSNVWICVHFYPLIRRSIIKYEQLAWIVWNVEIWSKNHIIIDLSSLQPQLTFLNVSRIHRTLAKPRIITGCCVNDMKIASDPCILTGNKYQSHWYSSKSKTPYWCVTISPNSHKKNIITRTMHIPIIAFSKSIKSVVWADYDFQRKIGEIQCKRFC